MRRILRKATAVAGSIALVGLGVAVVGTSAASAATLDGVATISTTNLATPLSGAQASNVQFGVKLPAGAACSGDTASGGYQVVSYMVPPSVFGVNGAGLSALTFTGLGVPSQGFAYITPAPAGTFPAYAPASTVPVTGVIQNAQFGPFQWGPDGFGPNAAVADFPVSGTQNATFNAVLIPSGSQSQVYETGIACIKGGVITDFWNAEITFTLNAADAGGNGYVWTPTTGAGANVPEAPLAVGLPAGAAAILVGAVVLNRRRRGHTAGTAATS